MGRPGRKSWIIAVVFLAPILLGAFGYWQFSLFDRGLRQSTGVAGEFLTAVMAPLALAPRVDTTLRGAPFFDQYRSNPAILHQRETLVTTWVNARQIADAVDTSRAGDGPIINSSSLAAIPVAERVDGWGMPYCVVADRDAVVVISSGGNGSLLSCAALRSDAEWAELETRDARLTRAGRFLVAVEPRRLHANPDRH